MFDNLSESAGLELKVTTDEVTFEEIAKIFTEVTGKKASHKHLSFEEHMPLAEPYPGALAQWSTGPLPAGTVKDDSSMTWRENFTAWWRYWGEGVVPPRDIALLNKIHPGRIKSLKEWMEKVQYDGKHRVVLKGLEDLKGGTIPKSAS